MSKVHQKREATLIVEEVKNKFEALKSFAPAHSEKIDLKKLQSLAQFLFDPEHNTLPHLEYPEEAEMFVWEVVSLLRVSCMSEFATELLWPHNSSLSKASSSPRTVAFNLSGLLSRLHGTSVPVITRALVGILYFMVPSLSRASSLTMLPIVTREHTVGYLVLIEDEIRNTGKQGGGYSQEVDLYRDTVLETVATRYLNKAVLKKSFLRGNETMVLLFSGRNFSLYPSAIEFLCSRGTRIGTAHDMHALKKSVKEFLWHHKKPAVTDCGNNSRDLSASLTSFLHELGDQISRIQEQLFFTEFREAVAQNRGRSLACSIVPNLHLCWYPAAIYLFEDENGEMRLQRGNVFHPVDGLPGEVILKSLSPEECGEYQKLLLSSDFRLSADRNSLFPIVQPFGEQIPAHLWPIDNLRPHTRLIIPLRPLENDSSTKSGWLELWFLESQKQVEAMAELLADFISRAHVVGRKYIEEFEKEVDSERLRLIAEASHSLKNWFHSIKAKLIFLGRTTEEVAQRTEILNQLDVIHKLFMGTIYLAREQGVQGFGGKQEKKEKYLEYFEVESVSDMKTFVDKLLEQVIDLLSANSSVVRKVLGRSATPAQFTEWLISVIHLATEDCRGLSIKTVPNIVCASLLEALENAVESCDRSLENPIKVAAYYCDNAAFVRVSTRVPREKAEELIEHNSHGGINIDPGLGLFAMRTYQIILEKQLGLPLPYAPLRIAPSEDCVIISEFGIGKIYKKVV